MNKLNKKELKILGIIAARHHVKKALIMEVGQTAKQCCKLTGKGFEETLLRIVK